LVLGGMSAAPLAQSPHKESAQKGQFAPMLTLPPATPSSPLRAPESTLEKVTLDAGALFNFDTYELRPEGRVALDAFIVRLQGASLGMIRVTGHADRLGSEAYNQILSEDRAEATKGYLISRGIGPDRVRAEGRGAAHPVTQPGECAGAISAKVIACLQPDRRVAIEVAGTRRSTNSAGLAK
jgi:OOP family OmpA-OmpF porin